MARVTVTFEDVGTKSVSFVTEISGIESPGDGASPAMLLGMATRAMFENGLLAQAAADALECIAAGAGPAEGILAAFSKRRDDPEGSAE